MKKIAIIGANPENKLLAPYDDPEWEIWACSNKNENQIPRIDALFEIHDLTNKRVTDILGPAYMEWIKTLPCVYTQETYEHIPGSVVYPFEEVIEAFGPYFLTCSISYMMAFAILDGAEEIGLWGLSDCQEYRHQRPSLFYFKQRAEEEGVKVTDHDGLLENYELYGYTDVVVEKKAT